MRKDCSCWWPNRSLSESCHYLYSILNTYTMPFCAKIKFQNCFLYLLQTYNFIQVLHILKTAPKLKSNYWNTRVRFNMFNFVSIKFAFRLTTSQRMQCYNFRMRGFSQLHTHYTHRDTLKWPQIYVYVSGDMFAVHPIDSHGNTLIYWFEAVRLD